MVSVRLLCEYSGLNNPPVQLSPNCPAIGASFLSERVSLAGVTQCDDFSHWYHHRAYILKILENIAYILYFWGYPPPPTPRGGFVLRNKLAPALKNNLAPDLYTNFSGRLRRPFSSNVIFRITTYQIRKFSVDSLLFARFVNSQFLKRALAIEALLLAL